MDRIFHSAPAFVLSALSEVLASVHVAPLSIQDWSSDHGPVLTFSQAQLLNKLSVPAIKATNRTVQIDLKEFLFVTQINTRAVPGSILFSAFVVEDDYYES